MYGTEDGGMNQCMTIPDFIHRNAKDQSTGRCPFLTAAITTVSIVHTRDAQTQSSRHAPSLRTLRGTTSF